MPSTFRMPFASRMKLLIFCERHQQSKKREATFSVIIQDGGGVTINAKCVPELAMSRTGDNSHIALWLALLDLMGTAILTLKRKTA